MSNRYNKDWTKEEDIKLTELVKSSKYSYRQIGEILGRTYGGTRGRAKNLGLSNYYKQPKIHTLNEHFWSIPNILNSYWAGFSAADASIHKKSVSYSYTLTLATKDIKHIKQLKKDCNYGGKISTYKRKSSFKNSSNKIFSSSSINISSKQWGEDLKNIFNIEENKVYRLSPPNLDYYLTMCWLVGYIDGDGTIFYDKKRNRLIIGFGSASQEIIIFIRNLINKTFPECLSKKQNKIYQKPKNNCYLFNIYGIKSCVIIDYLRQFPVPKLARKWENPAVLEYINTQKQKYPHLFLTLKPEEIAPYLPN